MEEVTDEILEELIKDHEYVAVFFRGPCDEEGDDCDAVLAKFESIDDDLDDIGILIVTTADKEVSRENGKQNNKKNLDHQHFICRSYRVACSCHV